MAILMSDYEKKYKNVIGNHRKQMTQLSKNEVEKVYKKEEKKYYQKQNELYNKYEEKGVKTPGKILNDNIKLPLYSQQKVLPSPSENLYKPLIQSREKANKVSATDSEIIKLQKQRESQYDKTANAYNAYLNKKLEDDNIGWFDKTFGSAISGVGSLLPSKYKLKNEDGNYYRVKNYSERKQEKILDSYETKLGKLYGTATYELGKIGATTVVNSISNMLVPGSGFVGTGAYFSDIFSDSYNRSIEDGYNGDQALTYATVSSASEMIIGKLLGGTTKALGMGTSELSESISKQLTKKLLTNHPRLANMLSSAVSEGSEEFVQEFLDKFNRNVILDEKNFKDSVTGTFNKEVLTDALYSGLVGSITGAVTGSFNSENYSNNANKNLLTNKNTNTQTEMNSQNITRNDKYTYETTDNEKINNFRKSASEYFNNSEQTHNFLNNIEKIITDKNYNVVFDTNINNNGKNVNAQIKTLDNGETEIRINPNSSKSGEFLIMHEVTHAIETDSMKKLVMDYASKHTDFKEALESLKTTYGVDDVTSEVLADISGQLFGNQEFINNLSMEQPSIFKRIYNSIISLANKITGNTNEALFIRDLKNKWETAYRTQNNNLNETQYMMTGIKGVKNSVKNDKTNIEYVKKYEEALDMANSKQFTNEQIWNKTYWFQDEERKWKFEISDKNSKITDKVNKNKTLKIGDALIHNNLYEMYPDLKKVTLKIKDIKPILDKTTGKYSEIAGYYTPLLNSITLNNKLIDKGNDYIRSTLIHELQHIIQKKENFNYGYKGNDVLGWENNLGEREAVDTESRINMTMAERLANKPKSLFEENQDVVYNISGGIDSENTGKIKKVLPETHKNTSLLPSDRGGKGKDAKELDNSSFSMENDKWQEYLENNYKSTGTKTNMQDIRLPKVQETIQKETKKAMLPLQKEIQKLSDNIETLQDKILNPLEISKLTPEDANTTPKLPNVKRNKNNDGDSKFYENVRDKVNMLTEEQKSSILAEDEVKYYDTVTNKESLEKAFERLEKDGKNESLKWFAKDSEKADAIDVAEGWILLKQYADNNDADGMVAVAKKLRDIGTKAGQTVQAFNIMARMTPEGMVKFAQSELTEAYNKMVKNKSKAWIDKHQSDFDLKPEEVAFIMETMKEVSTMEDGYDKRVKLAEIQKVMTDKLPPAKGAGIKAWMRISMLFNPKTQGRNVAGNAIIAPVNYFSDLFASVIDKQIAKKTGYRTTGRTKFKSYAKGFKKGFFESYNDFRKDINTRNIEGNRFEIGEGKSFNNKTVVGKALNRVDSLLSFMLDAGDRTFYEATFTNSINNQMVLNNSTEITQDMIDIATQEALSRTWQDNNTYSNAVLKIRKLLNGNKAYGLGDILIPFAKTPANLTKAIVDYSPAGLVSALVKGNNLKKSLSNGQYTPQMQHKFVQDLGKAIVGTALYVLGYALAKAKIVSGESDDDKDIKNFLENTLGIKSYSIKIGNKSFQYDWAQPIAAPLSIMANIVNSKDNTENALFEAIVGSLDSAGSILLEQSFVQSINDVLNNNDGVVSGLITEMLELPARAIPTFSKQIADMIDGTQRQTFEYDKPVKSAFNYAISKLPGLSKTLAPSIDTMGREIQKYGGKNNIFNVFLNPANVATENISESAKEIYDLYKATGDTTIMPRVAPYYVNKDGKKIILNSKQRSEYQKISGKLIEDNVGKLLALDGYNQLDNDRKSQVLTDIVNYSYNIAQKEVLNLELSDTYEKAYEYSKIGNISDYYTFKNSIDDTDSDTKRESIKEYLINSELSDEQLSFMYGSYYSSEEHLQNILDLNIPIKEFIKLDSEEITAEYNSKTGKAINNSKKQNYINYVNTLKLSVPQKAILIKMQYSTYNSYNNEIVNYVKKINTSLDEKKVLLKSIGFDNYNNDVVNYIVSQNISTEEKEKKLKNLGFTIRDGRVYR